MPIIEASSQAIARAGEALRSGEVVAFATETVYGLGASALDERAVARVFELKGRPASNPLIVHVSDAASASRWTIWNERAHELARSFWPGPLTLVLPANPANASPLAAAVSAGGTTLAVRAPAHWLARALLAASDVPLAAPSANRSNGVSPTRAAHVIASLGESLPVLDGGVCEVGLESSVLDLSGAKARLLRPGAIGIAELRALIGEVEDATGQIVGEATARSAPGLMARHYAPRARVHLFGTTIDAHFHAHLLAEGGAVGVLAFTPLGIDAREILLPEEPAAYARGLYAALHELDASGVKLILIEAPPVTREWDAVRDRLTRAAATSP